MDFRGVGLELEMGKLVRRHCYCLRICGSSSKDMNGSCGSRMGRKERTVIKERLSHHLEAGKRNKSKIDDFEAII